jgi:translation initiation factor 1 (eIF-1/SUI1)
MFAAGKVELGSSVQNNTAQYKVHDTVITDRDGCEHKVTRLDSRVCFEAIVDLLPAMKRSFGCGGYIDYFGVVLQGHHSQRVARFLAKANLDQPEV